MKKMKEKRKWDLHYSKFKLILKTIYYCVNLLNLTYFTYVWNKIHNFDKLSFQVFPFICSPLWDCLFMFIYLHSMFRFESCSRQKTLKVYLFSMYIVDKLANTAQWPVILFLITKFHNDSLNNLTNFGKYNLEIL